MNKKRSLRSDPPQRMKDYSSFSEWKEDQMQINELTGVVSEYIISFAPHLETTVKWGQGCFMKDDNPIIYIHTESDHIQLGFYSGSNLDDPNKYLEGKGKYVRHIKIILPEDIQNKNVAFFVEQVI